jgi:hypothetical protein
MSISIHTRPSKCKDCKWLKPEYLSKRKTHRGLNPMSEYFNSQRILNDLVCEAWELFK